MKITLSATIIFFFFFQASFGQDANIIGTVRDSVGRSLPNANILAFPKVEGENTKFAISDPNGKYQLRLAKNIPYSLEISYMGYEKLSTEHTALGNGIMDFVLKQHTGQLDEVVLTYKIPVQVKEDTITYNLDAFANGRERKLREVLKKLPGVEVDREGNVTAQGKKVTKVLVDNKTFFTGNSKLAVNNIPADAVGQIEILDNYNSVGFLKGLQDSDEMAMNIKLKGDRRKFAFGDLEAGGGIKDRYFFHPTLFYYTPKTNINFIGDVNNTGIKSFTLNDYIEFEGGFGKLMNNMKSYANLFNEDFTKYLSDINFKANSNRFGAFNLRQSLSKKMDINTYVIANGSTADTETHTLNEYMNNNSPFMEERTTTNRLKNFFIIGKITLDHTPSAKEKLVLNSFVKLTRNETNGQINTTSPQKNNTLTTIGELDGVHLKQNLEYSKKIAKSHTISLEAALDHQRNKPNTNWISDQPFLEDLVLLQEDSVFNVFQQKETQNTGFNFLIKDYWVLNGHNHLYTSFGSSQVFEQYNTTGAQQLSNGTVNSFVDEGFDNDISYTLNDVFMGLEYKFLTGILTVKPALYFHTYSWQNTQFGERLAQTTAALLPELTAEAEMNNSEKLHFKYSRELRFPNSQKLAGKFLLSDFNRVFRGKKSLSHERYHSFSLDYYKFNLFRGLNLNANILYNKKTQGIKGTTELQGIDQFSTLTMFHMPENGLSAILDLSKKINHIKYSLNGAGSYNEFFQIVNSNTSKNISRSLSATGKIETFFDAFPNVGLGYTYSPSVYSTNFSNSKFKNNDFFVNMEFRFLKDFLLKGDYSKVDFSNTDAGSENSFDIADVSLLYKKADSPWGFQIEATNLLDVQFKKESLFSDFLISDQSTFLLPRIIMFKISYKL